MIVYFADRAFNILGLAGDKIKRGYNIENDEEEIDIESGVATFSFDIYYTEDKRSEVEKITYAGNYILRKDKNDFKAYTIIDTEQSTENMSINVRAEDMGLDLINDVCMPFNYETADFNDQTDYAYEGNAGHIGYINESGQYVADQNYRATNYIDLPSTLPEACLFRVSKTETGSKRYSTAFYDTNKNFISGSGKYYYLSDSEQVSRVDVPSTAKYVRISFHKDITSAFFIPSSVKSYDISTYIGLCIANSGFEVGINEIGETRIPLEFEDTQTASERINEIVGQFGAEFGFSFEFDGMTITKKAINLYKHRGTDNRVELRLGREVKNIRINRSVAELATAIIPIGTAVDENGEDVYFSLQGYDGEIESGYYIEDNMLCSTKAFSKWSRYLSASGRRSGHIVKKFEYECSTQKTLYEYALSDLKAIEDAATTYEVELYSLPDSVSLGDTVYVVDDAGEIYISARVFRIRKSEINDTIVTELGDFVTRSSGIVDEWSIFRQKFAAWSEANSVKYVWVAYADDNQGTGISISPTGKNWMGLADNQKTQNVDLSDPSIFNWIQLTAKDGSDGAGIRSTTVSYAVSTSPNIMPGNNDWGSTIPTVPKGQVLWVRTVTDYTDDDIPDTVTYSYSIQGNDGQPGGQGAPGTSITVDSIEYVSWPTNQQPPDSASWQTTIPTVLPGDYLWTRTTFSDNKKAYGLARQGKDGESPEIEVTKNDDTVTITVTNVDGSTYTQTVTDGTNGTPGSPGTNGKPSYIHIAWANSADGVTDFSTSVSENKKYLGTYSDQTQADSSDPTKYKWSLIKGASVTVTKIEYAYQLSSSGTSVPTGTWQTTPQAPSTTQFAWTRTTTTFSDGNIAVTYTVGGKTGLQGSKGDKGDSGITNGYTIIWDSNQGNEYAGGEARICAYDQVTGTVSINQAGWVMWNGTKRTVPCVEFNPNQSIPYNVPIYIVLRLSSSSSTTGTAYPVWYNGGWKYLTGGVNAAASGTTVADWTWVEAADIVLAKCVEPANEAQFTETEIYDPAWTCKHVTNITVTANSALAAANSASASASDANSKIDNLQIGARNLLLKTAIPCTWITSHEATGFTVKDCYETFKPVNSIFEIDDLVTISFDWETTATSGTFHLECGAAAPWVWGTIISASGTRGPTDNHVNISESNNSGHYILTCKITSAQKTAPDNFKWLRIRVDGENASGKQFTISNAKAERGNRATDWTPAPEDTVYDRRLHNNYVRTQAAVNSKTFICGDASGYKQIAANTQFDLNFPILYYEGDDVGANTQITAYEAIPDVNPTYTGAVESAGVNKTLWLKVTHIAGSKFAVAETNFLTTVMPTSVDNYYYIPLGTYSNDSTAKLYFVSNDRLYAVPDQSEQYEDKKYNGQLVTVDNSTRLTKISDLSINLNPIQNLNGYDSPWVGGAGKNKLPTGSFTISGGGTTTASFATDGVHISGTKANGMWADYLVTKGGTLKANTSYVLSLGITNTSVPWSLTLRNGGTQLYEVIANNGSGTLTITPTSDVTFDRWRLTIRSNDALAVNSVVKPMLRLASETDATYEPYENICPISGHSSVTVERTGKNLFNGQFAYHNADKYSPVLDGETYTVSSKSTGAHQINLQYITKTNTYYGDHKIVSEGDTFGKTTVTIPTDVKGVLIYVNGDASNSQHTAYDTQIELGSSATEYEPFQSNTYTINLNGTRYGGTVDLVTGVLTVDRVSVDMGSLTWTYESATNCMITPALSGLKLPTSDSVAVDAITAVAKVIPASQRVAVSGARAYVFTGNRQMLFRDTGYTDPSAFKTAMNGNNIVYALETPQTYQLTLQQIDLLLGINNIHADSYNSLDVTVREHSIQNREFQPLDTAAILNSRSFKSVLTTYKDEQNGVFLGLRTDISSVRSDTDKNTSDIVEQSQKITAISNELKNVYQVDKDTGEEYGVLANVFTRVNTLENNIQTAMSYMSEEGLNVETSRNPDTVTTITGDGIKTVSSSDRSKILMYVNNVQTMIRDVSIIGYLDVAGTSLSQKNETEYDGTTSKGLAFYN